LTMSQKEHSICQIYFRATLSKSDSEKMEFPALLSQNFERDLQIPVSNECTSSRSLHSRDSPPIRPPDLRRVIRQWLTMVGRRGAIAGLQSSPRDSCGGGGLCAANGPNRGPPPRKVLETTEDERSSISKTTPLDLMPNF
jgi:hypothetical protein